MRNLTPPALLRAALAVLALSAAASAQGLVDARAALTGFPESQAVLFVNARRITTEALPRLLPKADYDKLIAQSRQVGFDVRDVDYLAAGIRFADPSQPAGIPEVLLVARGRFSAHALLTLARGLAGTQKVQPREENYSGRTLFIFELPSTPPAVGEGAGEGGAVKFQPMLFKEVAAVAFDDNTLMVGVPAYVRAAVDAAGGQGRLKTTLVDLAARDPQALWSLTAELPENLPQYAQKMGLPQNEEVNRVLGWLKQVSLSNGMDALNVTLRAAVLTDNPEHASALSGLARMGLTALESAAENEIAKKRAKPAEARQAQIALQAIRGFVNETDGSTVVLGASMPRAALAEIIQKEFVKKPAGKTGTATRRRPARRR